MSKNTIANGQGESALHTFSDFRKSRLNSFNRDLVAEAFLRDDALIDFSPTWNNSLLLWEVSSTDENGNCEAIASFETEKEGQRFINGLLLLSGVKGVDDKIKKVDNILPSDSNGAQSLT